MIPSVLAEQVQQGVLDFLRTTFPLAGSFFAGRDGRPLMDDLLAGDVFKGPYLSVALPFTTDESGSEPFADVPLGFKPFRHQIRAFERLRWPNPRSTLIATGTGSGKTECFLLPILDACLRQSHRPGIKAILIYPMNALATDQAGRLARAIATNPKLRGKLSAGLYVGGEGGQRAMSETGPVTDRASLRLKPPDILLTNYKMLDFLLLRAEDRPLWADNALRYLVVDELHGFDGAQGTDLACLIRRLKARLGLEPGRLCCVGTSATLGGDEGPSALLAYAARVFGESFEPGAVIGEQRMDSFDFTGDIEPWPTPADVPDIRPENHADSDGYVRAQIPLWFPADVAGDILETGPWRARLGDRLRSHPVLDKLLSAGVDRPKPLDEVAAAVWREQPLSRERGRRLLVSFVALISAARRIADGGRTGPFLEVRIQLWLRELTRLVCRVAPEPVLRFADDLTEAQRHNHLPLVYCRECGAAGWAATKRHSDVRVNPELKAVYQAFFARDPKLVFLFPEPEAGLAAAWRRFLCTHCLTVESEASAPCPGCAKDERLAVWVPPLRQKRASAHGTYQVAAKACPVCESETEMVLIGSRAASLISVQIAQLFGSPYNADKKLLAFSDSVQDAAHRAAFFAARTFRFNLRAALQQFVEAGGADRDLEALPAAFNAYWEQRLGLLGYLATFMPPNVFWREDVRYLLRRGKLPPGHGGAHGLPARIRRRVSWEIVSEYGFTARIGRSLEKSAVSITAVDPERLERALDTALEPLRNHIGTLRELQRGTLRQCLLGFLERGRVQGAFLVEDLRGYFTTANTYLFNKIWWMPNFGFRRAPRFWTDGEVKRFERLGTARKSRSTWTQTWLAKTLFADRALMGDEDRPALESMLKALVEAGILLEDRIKADRVWALAPTAFRVSRAVAALRCDICAHTTWCAAHERDWWREAPCTRPACAGGRYRSLKVQTDYYGKLYRGADVLRIYAEEHTGLLDRDRREDLETRFKARGEAHRPWFPNLLSCTPTLEMGIDIGDLSTVILCSVPPKEAQYLQRIGRAGRRDGNALILAVANGRDHDLFFFARPDEMLAGHVTTPAVFLGAAAVLERQLMAFCIDAWPRATGQAVPRALSEVLTNLKAAEMARFPHNLLQYVENHRAPLLAAFLDLFPGMAAETREQLTRFLQDEDGGGLRFRVLSGLHAANTEVKSLNEKIRKLNARKRKLESHPARDQTVEAELRELQRERAGLRVVVKKIRDRPSLQYFTDEGLLPNYAFPEAGVVLRSMIYRKKQRGDASGGTPYDTWTYEYERPASSALVELAPASTFYAGGYRVRVSRIDLKQSEIEAWRFCDRCSHSEREGERPGKTCPRCGSTMWPDRGRKRAMVRLRAVYASTSASKAQIGDDHDEREPQFFLKSMLVDVEPGQVELAYHLDSASLPFGFEYIGQAQFREINFGKRDPRAEESTIAGEKEPRAGFTLCTQCGTVQGAKEAEHAYGCPAREGEARAHYRDCVYLYREFASEAIRMLLPVTTFAGSQRKLQSFIAALHLGLKLRFGGHIDHLTACRQEEPVPGQDFRKKYLVLFDTVPGGTGYLKQLVREKHALMEVLAQALDHLKACVCRQDPAKDGCYRCLFAYRQSYYLAETSRNEAIGLLAEMVARRDKLVPVTTLTRVVVNGLYESELEARFVDALRSGCRAMTVKREFVNGIPGHFLTVGEREYFMEQQVVLDYKQGVAVPSRADFVIRPVRETLGMKSLAVFVDGFAYHRDRLGQDLAQRMAINAAGSYRTWTLTWHDIESRFQAKVEPVRRNFLEPCRTRVGSHFLRSHEANGVLMGLVDENSFDWLERWLADPSEEVWAKTAAAHFLCWIDAKLRSDSRWWDALNHAYPRNILERFRMQAGLAGRFPHPEANWGQGHVAFTHEAAQSLASADVRLLVRVDDGEDIRTGEDYQHTWRAVLQAYNLAQFLPCAAFVTREGMAQQVYAPLRLGEEGTASAGELEDAVTEWVDADEAERLRTLLDHDLPMPKLSYEWPESHGEVAAQAALAWPAAKLALVSDDDPESRAILAAAGWRVLNLDATVDEVAVLLKGSP